MRSLLRHRRPGGARSAPTTSCCSRSCPTRKPLKVSMEVPVHDPLRNHSPLPMTTLSSPPVSRWRRLLAVLLSITPGCGHVLWGRWRRGLVWLGALLLAQASLPLTGFAGLLLGLGVFLGAAVDVARLPPPEAG